MNNLLCLSLSLSLQCICTVQLGPVYPGESRGIRRTGEFMLQLGSAQFLNYIQSNVLCVHASDKTTVGFSHFTVPNGKLDLQTQAHDKRI